MDSISQEYNLILESEELFNNDKIDTLSLEILSLSNMIEMIGSGDVTDVNSVLENALGVIEIILKSLDSIENDSDKSVADWDLYVAMCSFIYSTKEGFDTIKDAIEKLLLNDCDYEFLENDTDDIIISKYSNIEEDVKSDINYQIGKFLLNIMLDNTNGMSSEISHKLFKEDYCGGYDNPSEFQSLVEAMFKTGNSNKILNITGYRMITDNEKFIMIYPHSKDKTSPDDDDLLKKTFYSEFISDDPVHIFDGLIDIMYEFCKYQNEEKFS